MIDPKTAYVMLVRWDGRTAFMAKASARRADGPWRAAQPVIKLKS